MSNPNQHEQTCIHCDGAGTVEDKGAPLKIALCPGCNGHGKVVYVPTEHRVAKYAQTTEFSQWIN